MAAKSGKDYLHLVWKCTSNRRQYIVSQFTKDRQYEFQYGGEIKDTIRVEFKPLVSLERLGNIYKCEESFPVFSSRLPDEKEKDTKEILEKYKLEECDSHELLKRSGTKLPVDDLQFTDPILDFEDEFEKRFYVAGVRHYLGCEGEKCAEMPLITRDDEVFLEQEKNNRHDKDAIHVVNERRRSLGYVPRYYTQVFNKFIEEKGIRECHVINIGRESCRDECICILLEISELED